MPPPPFLIWFVAAERLGFSWSRFGPTVPFEFAALRVWQPPQPADEKTLLPAEALPFACCSVGALPMTVSATGLTVSPLPQPARTRTTGTRARSRRGTAAILQRRFGALSARRTAATATRPAKIK